MRIDFKTLEQIIEPRNLIIVTTIRIEIKRTRAGSQATVVLWVIELYRIEDNKYIRGIIINIVITMIYQEMKTILM